MSITATEREAEAVAAYIRCALWASNDPGGTPLDDLEYELAPEAEDRMRTDVLDFIAANAELLSYLEPAQWGHDLWLTRNGHGAGFWDRGIGEAGDKLTDRAHALGTADLYIGDDGLIYVA